MPDKKVGQRRSRRKKRRPRGIERAEVSIPKAPSRAHPPEHKAPELPQARLEESLKRRTIEVECRPASAEDTEPWRSSIERLKQRFMVSRAVDLHPRLNFADEGRSWPLPGWGVVTPDVLEKLQQARAILIAMGFRVDADPLNDLGDGKSWTLTCETTDNVPNVAGLADLVDQTLRSEGLPVATKPFWDKGKLLVDVWDSQRVSAQPAAPDSNSQELLQFVRRGNQIVAAPCQDRKTAVANTCALFVRYLREVKSIVRSSGGKVSVKGLRKDFKDADFGRALQDEDWQLLIEEFTATRSAGLRNLAVALLAKKTGLRNHTVDTYAKASRKRRKTVDQ